MVVEDQGRVVAPRPACWAPSAALRLSPTGDVHACGPNWAHALGNVADRSLHDIWHGEPVRRLRAALAAGDFALGCQECGIEHDQGTRHASHAREYDRFAGHPPGAYPARIEFGLSNLCNLQCLPCNGDLSSAIRGQREHRPPLVSPYGDAFFDDLADFLPHLEVATFLGGEPFLAPENRRVWDLLIELGCRPEVHVTTNGTVWNERVEHYVRTLEMGVSVSIDGVHPTTMATLRHGSNLDKVRAVRDHLLEVTRSYGGSFGLNHCVMRQNWRELGPFLLEADALEVPVHAIRVQDPSSSSLFALDDDQLRRVVDTWGQESPAMLDRLDVNREVWRSTVAIYARHLADRTAPSEVPVSVDAVPDAARAEIRRVEASLRGRSALPPLAVEVVDGRIDAVEAPPWAASLHADRWVGEDLSRLMAVVETTLGPTWGAQQVVTDGDQQWWVFPRLEAEPEEELRVGVESWHRGRSRRLHVLLSWCGGVALALPDAAEAAARVLPTIS